MIGYNIDPEWKQPDHYPLKQKYLVNKSYNFGTYRSRTGNSNGITPKKRENSRPRKRAYGPF